MATPRARRLWRTVGCGSEIALEPRMRLPHTVRVEPAVADVPVARQGRQP